MDFHQMKRKQLQSLCKKHGIPANLKNVEMADRLSSILKGNGSPEGVEEPSSADLVEIGHETYEKDLPQRAKKVRFSPHNETFVFVISDTESTVKKKRPGRRSYGKKLKNSGLAAKNSQAIEDSTVDALAEAEKLKGGQNDRSAKKRSSDTVPGEDSTERSLDLDPTRKELQPRRSKRKSVRSRLLSDEEFSVGKIAYATQLLEPVINEKPGCKRNRSKKTVSKGANMKQKRGSTRGSADILATPESESSMAPLESSNLNPEFGRSEIEFDKAATVGISEKVEARPGKEVSTMDHDARNTGEEACAALELDKSPVAECMDSNTVSTEGNKMEDNPNEVSSLHNNNSGITGEVVPCAGTSPMTSPCGDSHAPLQLEEGGPGTEPVNQEQEISGETVEAGDCLVPVSTSPVRASGPNYMSQESVLAGQEEELQPNANLGRNSLEVVKKSEKSYHLDCNTAAETSFANPATELQDINSGLLPAISESAKDSIDCTEGSGQNSPLPELVRMEQIKELRDDKSSGSDPGDMIEEAEESDFDWKSTEQTNQSIPKSYVFGGEGHPSKDECADHDTVLLQEFPHKREVSTDVAGEAQSVQEEYPEARGDLVIAELHTSEGADPNGQITDNAKHEASEGNADGAPMETPEKLPNVCSANKGMPNTIRTATEKSSGPIVPMEEDEHVREDEILVSKTEDGRSNEEEMVRDEIDKDNTFDLGRDSLCSVEEWPREEWQPFGIPIIYLGHSASGCQVEEDKKAILLIAPEDNRVDKSENASPRAVCQSLANISGSLFSSCGRPITPKDSEHGVCAHDVSVSNNKHVTGYEEEVMAEEDGIQDGLNFSRESISSGEMRLHEDSRGGGMTLSCLRKSAPGSEIEKAKDYSESRRKSCQRVASAEERKADEDDYRSADSALQSPSNIPEVLFSSSEYAFSPKGGADEDDKDESDQEHSPNSIMANNAGAEVAWSAERRNLTMADRNSSVFPPEEPNKLCSSKMDDGIGFENPAESCEANGAATVCKDLVGISNNSNEEVGMAKCSSEMNISSLEVCGEENVQIEQSSSISPDGYAVKETSVDHELPLNGLDSECPQDKENVSAKYGSSSHTMLNIDIDSKLNFESKEGTHIPVVQMAPAVTEDGENLENSLPAYEEVVAEEQCIRDEAAVEGQFIGDQVAAQDQYMEEEIAAEEQFIGDEATPEEQVSLLTKSYNCVRTASTAKKTSDGISAFVSDSWSKRRSETKFSAISQVRTSTDCENGTSDCDSQLFTSREVSLLFGEGKTNAAEELLLEADADSMEVVTGITDMSGEKDLTATVTKYNEHETSEDEQVEAEDFSKHEKEEALKLVSDVPAVATDVLMTEATEETLEDDDEDNDASAMIKEYIDRENERDTSVEIENPSLSINKEPSEECDWSILMEESTAVSLVKAAEVLVSGDAAEYGDEVQQKSEEFKSKHMAPSQTTLKEMNSLKTPRKSVDAYDMMKENICGNTKRDQLGGNATAGKTSTKGRKALEELQKNPTFQVLGNNC